LTNHSASNRDDLPDTELLAESDTEVIAPTSRTTSSAKQSGLRKRCDTQGSVLGRAGADSVRRARAPSGEKMAVRAWPIGTRASLLIGLAATLALIGAGGYYRWKSGADAALNEMLPPPPEVAVKEADSERISRIIGAAELHMRVGRFTEPEGSNAYVAYSEVLRLDPANPQALEGMQKIAQHYLDAARAAIKNDRSRRALAEIQHALTLFPENVELRALRDRITEDATAQPSD
jgi:hypothetical protein